MRIESYGEGIANQALVKKTFGVYTRTFSFSPLRRRMHQRTCQVTGVAFHPSIHQPKLSFQGLLINIGEGKGEKHLVTFGSSSQYKPKDVVVDSIV